MKAGWEVKPLGEVCELIKRGIAPKYVESGGIVVINQKCIRDHKIDFSLARRNDLENKPVPDERLIRLGDVLVNSTGTGTLGRVAQVRDQEKFDATVDTHVTIVRPIEGKFYPPFFGYMMRVIEDEIKDAGQGVGGQTELSRDALINSFSVSYPNDTEEQKRIVAVLDAAFEGLTRAKENADANLQNARELFESGLEELLEKAGNDCPTMTLGDVCEFVGGSQPPKSEFLPSPSPDAIRLIQIRDYKTDDKAVYIPKAMARRFCAADDIMIGRYGPPLFQILRGIEGAYNVALMKAVPDPSIMTKDFLFYFLRNRQILRYIVDASDRAAGQIGINKKTIEPYPVSVPSLEEQGCVVERLGKMEAKSKLLEFFYAAKLTDIADLRQSLLQKAFAGELT